MDLARLHSESLALITRLADRLPEDRLTAYRSLSDAGEWAELLDELCAALVTRKIAITTAERDHLAVVLAMLGSPDPGYAFHSNPTRVLTSLTVV